MSGDISGLVAYRSEFPDRHEHTVLPHTISEEPLGPVVPHGDDRWFDVVKTIMGMLIYAEAYGVSSGSVPTAVTGDTRIDRLFGLEGSYGQESLGISITAAQDVISLGRQLRRDIRPQPGQGRHQPAAREQPKCALGRRPLYGLPKGRPDLRRTFEIGFTAIPAQAGFERNESGVASCSLSPSRERAGVRG